MLVLVQWTRALPQDWEEVEHTDWPRLPNMPVHALNVQGVIFEGYDHYSVGAVVGGCTVTVWNDDPEGDPPMRWVFYHPAPDITLGGRVNTRQVLETFSPAHPLARETTSGGKVRVRSRFVPPANPRHGQWVSDDLHERHRSSRALRSWEEWANG